MSMGKSGTCLLEIEFTLKPGKRREFNRSFDDLHGHEGEGHVRTAVFEDCEEPGRMIWIAGWNGREFLERYLSGERFGVLIGGLRVLGTVTDCRVVDEVEIVGSPPPVPPDRAFDQRRFTRVQIDSFEH